MTLENFRQEGENFVFVEGDGEAAESVAPPMLPSEPARRWVGGWVSGRVEGCLCGYVYVGVCVYVNV